jgi:hypothetical protein
LRPSEFFDLFCFCFFSTESDSEHNAATVVEAQHRGSMQQQQLEELPLLVTLAADQRQLDEQLMPITAAVATTTEAVATTTEAVATQL